MSFFQKVKCRTGFHIFAWKSAGNPSEPCELVSVCAACHKRSTKVEHDFAPWEEKPGHLCHYRRSCRNCDRTEKREDHSDGQPYYVAEYSCDQQQTCTRCGRHEQVLRPSHQYAHVYAAEWRPNNPTAGVIRDVLDAVLKTSPGPCDQIYVCRRCDDQRFADRREWHDWSQWAHRTERELIRTCGRCRERENKWV